MQRDMIESIITSLDTGTLLKMLATQGINIQGADPTSGEELVAAAGDGDKITSWNEMRVPGASAGRPPIHTPEAYVEQKMQQRPEYLSERNAPMEDWYVDGPVGQ